MLNVLCLVCFHCTKPANLILFIISKEDDSFRAKLSLGAISAINKYSFTDRS